MACVPAGRARDPQAERAQAWSGDLGLSSGFLGSLKGCSPETRCGTSVEQATLYPEMALTQGRYPPHREDFTFSVPEERQLLTPPPPLGRRNRLSLCPSKSRAQPKASAKVQGQHLVSSQRHPLPPDCKKGRSIAEKVKPGTVYQTRHQTPGQPRDHRCAGLHS